MEETTNTLSFRWTVSRGRDTYGYNICSLWVDGYKKHSCNGGGYDMAGTCLGNWIQENFQDELKKLTANYGSGDDVPGFYGLSFYLKDGDKYERLKQYQKDCGISLDGACGFESMSRLAKEIGIDLQYVEGRTNHTIYLATYNQKG